MVRRGFHGTYLGGHTIIYVHPAGGSGNAARGRTSWGQTGSVPDRLLSPSEVDRIRHVKKVAPRHSKWIDIQFKQDVVDQCEVILGYEKPGFQGFVKATNLRLENLEGKDLLEVAEAFNRRRWTTLTGIKWTAMLVGVFIQRFGTFKKGAKGVIGKSKQKKRDKVSK